MPPKKRKSVGQNTPDAKRVGNTRSVETTEETQLRRSLNVKRLQTSRASETIEQTKVRQSVNRQRMQKFRDNQDSVERQLCLISLKLKRNDCWSIIEGEALRYDGKKDYESYPIFDIGRMKIICPHCNALKWNNEPKGICCLNGEIQISPLQTPPDPLQSLLTGESPKSKQFLGSIRKYNSCFQMTSFGSNQVREPGFMPTFKVQGQVYHRAGSLLPSPGQEHKFLQIYFIGDEEDQVQQRCNYIPGVDQGVVLDLQRFLHQNNTYVKDFKTALDNMPTDEYQVVIRADKVPTGEHERRFNAPSTNEVAIVVAGNEFDRHDIILQKRHSNLQRISETHRSYDSLQYPLMFWQGEDGYHLHYKQTDPNTRAQTTKKVSAMNFYAYRMMLRDQSFNHILRFRQLSHQFFVDMYAKIESERLLFVRLNQKKLRADDYIHLLRDAVANDGDVKNHGQLIILPSTYTGSPRYMHEYTQDAMTYVRNYGRPDLFITFTCNPKWPEIEREKHYDRHDLTARVFRLKLSNLMDTITKGHVFGPTRCKMVSIEWQKRGLPHAHILIWLKTKLRSNQIDNFISAELPDPVNDPILFGVITKNMIHGPCGSLNPNLPCMKEGKCTKKYPRDLFAETQTGDDCYPLYRRRKPGEGGFQTIINMKINNSYKNVSVDNKWVVPYCSLLSRMFKAHINVEYRHSVKSIKYICKYVNKGNDQAVFRLENGNTIDEIDNYRSGRYISSNEAVWRILDFPIHERYPTVVHLSVHMENGQRVYFSENNILQRIQEPPRTTLTAFFALCQQDDFAKTLFYCDVPKYYTWNASQKTFKRRVQGVAVLGFPGIKESDALGRVYTVHPNNFECYFLRLLLNNVKGPTSFEHLKTIDGQVCETFREACNTMGLLEDDSHLHSTMLEAAASHSPTRLRTLFAIILTTCGPSDPIKLWESDKERLSEDILFELQQQSPDINIDYSPDIFNKTLVLLEDKILSIGRNLQELGLPAPNRDQVHRLSNEVLRETSYNSSQLEDFVKTNEPMLLHDQRRCYESIINMVEKKSGGLVFIDAPGGTGKTFVINLILAKIRKDKKIALAVASSGIAATLFSGGRTAHSVLKLPLNLRHSENPMCNISKNTGTAKILQECEVIVWDESIMSHKHAIEALDRTLQDLRENQTIMGGVVVILAGDFRQTLPIIPKGTMADELKACLKSSYLWHNETKLNLTTNMRIHLQGDNSAGRFAQQLLDLGEGKFPVDPVI